MDIAGLRHFFGWCAILNMGLLMYWFVFVRLAGDWVYNVHSKWFVPITREQFNGIHYAGISFFKIAIFVFNIVPYLALLIIQNK